MRGHIASQLIGIALGVPGLVVEGLGFKNTGMYLYYTHMHTKNRYTKGFKGILLAIVQSHAVHDPRIYSAQVKGELMFLVPLRGSMSLFRECTPTGS